MALAMAILYPFVQHPVAHNYKVHLQHLLPVINQKVIEMKARVEIIASRVGGDTFYNLLD